MELFAGIEHDRDHLGRIGVERGADAQVGGFENRDRALGERGFRGAFEQDREVIGELAAETAVKAASLRQASSCWTQPRMAGCVDERLLVGVDRAFDVSRLVQHRAEHQRRFRQLGSIRERVDQQPPGIVFMPLQTCGDAGAEQQRRLLRRDLERGVERRAASATRPALSASQPARESCV